MKKILVILCIVLLTGCKSKGSEENRILKVGLMPSLDSTPIIWAQKQGYFEKYNVDLEIVVYSNANDRDAQIQTGAVDAVISDLMGLMAMKEAGYEVVGVSKTDTIFSVVSSKEISTLENVSVGMGEISVTHYAAQIGLQDKLTDKQFIEAIPQRLEMVKTNMIDAGILPEPMASMAILSGLNREAISIESPNILMFSEKSVNENQSLIEDFYKAYNEGAKSIKDNTLEVKKALIETLSLNPAIEEHMILPEFSEAETISSQSYSSIQKWMKDTLNMDSTVGYNEAVISIKLK